MDSSQILQLLIGVSILYVWLIRSRQPSKFRVGNANTLREEVNQVGLPNWSFNVIKITKPFFAFFLLLGLMYKPLTFPCASLISIFMIGALWMHLQAKDNFYKMIPALTLLFFCAIIILNN
jgi:hypothetical protein